MFGTYTHARPDGRVFYVGKGTEKRAFSLTPDKRRCNKHHANIVKKYGAENIIVGWVACESEKQALGLEMHLIATCKEIGIKLCNQTDGGEGVSGLKHSKETCAKLSALKIGNKNALGWVPTQEMRNKISAAGKGRSPPNNGKSWNTEIRAKISASRKGKGLGRVFSEETRAKIGAATSAALKGKTIPQEVRAKISIALKGKTFSEEHLNNLRDSWKKRSASEIYREKLRAAWRRRKGEAK